MISRRAGVWLLIAFTAAVCVGAALFPRTPQPLAYHDFADKRAWQGIPNFGDVISNVAFAIAGAWGLTWLTSRAARERFVEGRERWAYGAVFLGLLLTAFGSSYYHLAPDNTRLVWDRLPMTIAFMGLVAALIAERISVRAGIVLLPVLLAIGLGSVLQWRWSELQGRGDLRFYAAVQLYAMLAVLLALFLKPRYTRGSDLAVLAAFYILAKVAETFDTQIFSLGHVMSGHTIKHV